VSELGKTWFSLGIPNLVGCVPLGMHG